MNQNLEFAKIGIGAAIALVLTYDVFLKPEPKVRYMDNGGAGAAVQNHQPQANNQFQDQGASTTFDPNNAQMATPNEPPKPVGPTTTIEFAQSHHDFGTIKQNTDNEYKFTFTNTGSNPLIIQEASGSCGCTVPQFPKEPIAPGESSEITVNYKPGLQEGQQNKTVTLVANTEPNIQYLTIGAVVEKE